MCVSVCVCLCVCVWVCVNDFVYTVLYTAMSDDLFIYDNKYMCMKLDIKFIITVGVLNSISIFYLYIPMVIAVNQCVQTI